MFSLGPAVLFIEVESEARKARSLFPKQAQQLEKTMDGMRRRRVSCAEIIPGDALSLDDILDLTAEALGATWEVNRAFASDTPFWEYKKGLPGTASFYSVYNISGAIQGILADLSYRPKLCRRIPEGDDAALRREEQRSQAWLDEQRLKLEDLYARLTAAKAAYERDRPKLTALAWSLGILQAVGWSILYFSILPYEFRAWRERRAQRKKGSAAG
jgi:hypothetical protein